MADATTTDTAHILDRGYRAYEGSRAGVPGAIGSVAWHSLRATLGLGRSARHKIFPVTAIVIAFLPAIVFAGLAAFLDIDLIEDEILPEYYEYYGFIGTAIVLFCALVTPDILVSDRRNGMLPLYMSTPLKRWSYLCAKAVAVVTALAIVTLGPVVLLLVAYTLEGSGPGGVGDWFTIVGRILLSGVAVSAAFAAVSLAAASLTDRRAIASVGVILLILGSGAIASGLVDGADLSPNWWLISIITMPFELVQRIYDVDPRMRIRDGENPGLVGLSNAVVVLANIGWTALGAGVVWWRYRRLVVSR